MKLFFLISYLTILFGCSSKTGLKPIFEIDGLFKPKDIGLDLGGFNNEVDRYFSVNIINNDSVPFNIYTNKDEKFYYPTSIQYTYIDETDGIRKSGRGISDFYSVKTTSILPYESRKFYFYASIVSNSDTVDFTFEFRRKETSCLIETKYLLNKDTVKERLNYLVLCN